MKARRHDLKKKAHMHFESGGIAKNFSQKYGIPRTTVLGWMKAWQKGEREPDVGRPLKLGSFKSAEILEEILEQYVLMSRGYVSEVIRRRSTYKMSRLCITRYLRRWDIFPETDEFQRFASLMTKDTVDPHRGVSLARMWVDFRQWIAPQDLIGQFSKTPQWILWRVISRRGMECFTFTQDLTNDSLEHVVKLLSKNSNWQVFTNCPQLVQVLRDRRVECVEILPLIETGEGG